MAEACIEGHNIAEERLRAEAEISQEVEADQIDTSAPAEEEDKGPEVIIIPKKDEGQEETETEETNAEEY